VREIRTTGLFLLVLDSFELFLYFLSIVLINVGLRSDYFFLVFSTVLQLF
jgi:hypothetical protein